MFELIFSFFSFAFVTAEMFQYPIGIHIGASAITSAYITSDADAIPIQIIPANEAYTSIIRSSLLTDSQKHHHFSFLPQQSDLSATPQTHTFSQAEQIFGTAIGAILRATAAELH